MLCDAYSQTPVANAALVRYTYALHTATNRAYISMKHKKLWIIAETRSKFSLILPQFNHEIKSCKITDHGDILKPILRLDALSHATQPADVDDRDFTAAAVLCNFRGSPLLRPTIFEVERLN